MRIDITEKNMVWLVEHKMADTIVAEFHRKEAVIESLVRERDEARAEVERLTEIIRREVDGGVDLREEAQRTVEENHNLRAELASLRASSFVTAVPSEEYEKLKAEVERLTNRNKGANMEAEEHCRRAMELRKAGDAMQDAVETYFELLPMLVNEVRAKAMLKGRKAIKEWNAAKEGKQSEEVLWVQLEDYEKLKAEVERLRKWMDDISLDTEGRLDSGLNVGWTLLKIKQEYNAAKEGKQS